MNEKLLDYALDQLAPEARKAVEAELNCDPAARAKLASIRLLLAPLEADRELDEAPDGLAVAGLARTAEYLVENGLFTSKEGFFEPDTRATLRSNEPNRFQFTRAHANVAVAASIGFLVILLGGTAVHRSRAMAQTAQCQNNLREVHVALAGYSENHSGRFPQAGTFAVPTAGAFLDELTRNGQPIPDSARACPLQFGVDGGGYAYSLGFRDPHGRLYGLKKPDSADDLTPIVADGGDADTPPKSHGGWNVLFVGGAVRKTTTSHIGLNGDDIFRNDLGQRQAGLHRDDASLGRPFDVP